MSDFLIMSVKRIKTHQINKSVTLRKIILTLSYIAKGLNCSLMKKLKLCVDLRIGLNIFVYRKFLESTLA